MIRPGWRSGGVFPPFALDGGPFAFCSAPTFLGVSRVELARQQNPSRRADPESASRL